MAYTSSRSAVFVLLFLAAGQLAFGQDTQESLLASQDADFKKLTEAYDDLMDLTDKLDEKSSPKPSLRHHRTLALAHSKKNRDTPSNDDVLKAQTKVEDVSNDLKETVTEAIHHVKDGVILKHDIAQKGVKLRIDDKKLRKLEKEEGHLAETKESLFSSLHRMLDSKIDLARTRVEKKEAVLQKTSELAKEWQIKAEELKAVSKEKIQEKHTVKKALIEAEEEVARAKEKESELRRKLERKTQEVSEKVQSFQYAETRYQAQLAHAKNAKEAAIKAKESLRDLTRTLEVESQKVEESVDIRKVQIDHKMHAIEEDKEKSSEELHHLKGEFSEWKRDTQKEKADIVRKRREQERVSEEAAEKKRQRKLRQPSMTKGGHFTTGGVDGGDWDSWGSSAQTDSDIEDTN